MMGHPVLRLTLRYGVSVPARCTDGPHWYRAIYEYRNGDTGCVTFISKPPSALMWASEIANCADAALIEVMEQGPVHQAKLYLT